MDPRIKKTKQKKEWKTDSLETIGKMEEKTFKKVLASFQTMPLEKSFLYKNTLRLCRTGFSNHVDVYGSAAIEELVTQLTNFFLPIDGKLYIPDYSSAQQRMLLPHLLCKAFDHVFNKEKIKSIHLKEIILTHSGLVFKNEVFTIHLDILNEIHAMSKEFHNKHKKIATPKLAERVPLPLTTSLDDIDNEDSIFPSPQLPTLTLPIISILRNSISSSSSNFPNSPLNNSSILNTFIHKKSASNYMPENYTKTLLQIGSPIITDSTSSSNPSTDDTTSSILSNTPLTRSLT